MLCKLKERHSSAESVLLLREKSESRMCDPGSLHEKAFGMRLTDADQNHLLRNRTLETLRMLVREKKIKQ